LGQLQLELVHSGVTYPGSSSSYVQWLNGTVGWLKKYQEIVSWLQKLGFSSFAGCR